MTGFEVLGLGKVFSWFYWWILVVLSRQSPKPNSWKRLVRSAFGSQHPKLRLMDVGVVRKVFPSQLKRFPAELPWGHNMQEAKVLTKDKSSEGKTFKPSDLTIHF